MSDLLAPKTGYNRFTKGATLNRLYPAGIMEGAPVALITSTTAPSINQLYAMAFPVKETTTFDIIALEVTSAGTNSQRLGIYADNGGYPGTLLFDSGNITNVGTGLKTATITAGLQSFSAGLYWLTFETMSTSPQVRALPGTFGYSIIGYPSPPSTTLPGLCYTVAHTVGALPNPFTSGATIRSTVSAVSSPIPAVMLRAIA